MSNKNIWDILGLHVTTDRKAIQKAYAKKTKLVHPEEHPEEFMELHEAYKKAIHFAKRQKSITIERTPSPKQPAEKNATPSFDFSSTTQKDSEDIQEDVPAYTYTKAAKQEKQEYLYTKAKMAKDEEKTQANQDYSYESVFENTAKNKAENEQNEQASYVFTHQKNSTPTKAQESDKKAAYDFSKKAKPSNKDAKAQPVQKQEQAASTQPTRQTQEAIAYGLLFEEARKKQEEQKKQKHRSVREQFAQYIANSSLREKDWKQFIESDEFQQIAEDKEFLQELVQFLSSYDVLPLPCFLTLSAYYQYVDATLPIQKELNEVLALLDSQYPIYEKQKIRKQKKLYLLLLISASLILLLLSVLSKSIVIAAMVLPICITFFTYSYFEAGNAGRNLHKKQWMIFSIVVLLSTLFPIFAYRATAHDPKEDAMQYLQDTYTQDFSYVRKAKGTTATSDALVFQFQDPESQMIFEVKLVQKKDGSLSIEDNYASSYVHRQLSMENGFSSHALASLTDIHQYFEKIESYDILLQKDSDIDSIANTLYTLAQDVSKKDIYPQCKEYTFYCIGKKTSYTQMLSPLFTVQELVELSKEDIHDMLMQAYVSYQLDYTLQEMDPGDPYVKQYYADSSGIDIRVDGQDYHFENVKVTDGRITLGNFYRLAKHFNWNIHITGEESFTWEYHGRVQVFDAGSLQPYIEQSFLETILWGKEILQN